MTTAYSSALIRFVADGLIATIDSYREGQLPLHRLDWELRSRLDSLNELCGDRRVMILLRWPQPGIENLPTALRDTGRSQLTDSEQNALTVALASLRAALRHLSQVASSAPGRGFDFVKSDGSGSLQ
ncbi:MAG: hypothetical protein JO100_15505 [Pseudonocardia sp.]|jgi:hypothetical protein|nr:hypothetical protein [Pseudonocardia sp.]